MNKKIVFFNGPPRVGKDTLVTGLLSKFPTAINIKFSTPLKSALPVFFGLTQVQINKLEQDKDTPKDYFLGKSWREVQISLSENWAKPIFGKKVFGNITKNIIENENDANIFLISDSGFQEEAAALIEYFGKENCLLIRLKREGTNFDNDSRSYWENIFDIKEITLYNDKSIEAGIDKAQEIIIRWIERKF
jgi:hypothetical protein